MAQLDVTIGIFKLKKMISEENSREIARLLEHTASCTFELQLNDIIPAFDKAEVKCLLLALSADMKLETKRRVVEWKLRLFCDRNAPFDLVKPLHNSVIDLGYSNLEVESNIEIYYAQYCERIARREDSLEILQRLRAKLDNALAKSDSEVYRYFIEICESMQNNGANNTEQ